MRYFKYSFICLAVLQCAACGSNLTCDEPQRYQSAQEGTRVTPPADLDELETSREMSIPRASPKDPRPPGSPCLELPPTVQASPTSPDEEPESDEE